MVIDFKLMKTKLKNKEITNEEFLKIVLDDLKKDIEENKKKLKKLEEEHTKKNGVEK